MLTIWGKAIHVACVLVYLTMAMPGYLPQNPNEKEVREAEIEES
jgi:hypothetical protein